MPMTRVSALAAVFLVILLAAAMSTAAPVTSGRKYRHHWGEQFGRRVRKENQFNLVPCPFNSTAPRTLCANVSVPANWDDQGNTPEIFVYVSFLFPKSNTSAGVLWFLDGGSGVSAECLGRGNGFIDYYLSLGFIVALPDFRGAGLSTPQLNCPDDPNVTGSPSIACAKYYSAAFGPAGMYNYSVTMGSHDLSYLINQLTEAAPTKFTSNLPHFIHGSSFGTFWAQRFITVFPQHPHVAAMAVDSFLAPNRYRYFDAIDNIDWITQRVLFYCGIDVHCSRMLGGGGSVFALFQRLQRKAIDGTLPCNSRLPSRFAPSVNSSFSPKLGWWGIYAQALANLGGTANRNVQATVPALVYRLARCNDDDVTVLTHMLGQLFPASSTSASSSPGFSLGPSATTVWDLINPSSPIPKERSATKAATKSTRDACTISQVIAYNGFMSEGVPTPAIPLEQLRDQYNNLTVFILIDGMLNTRKMYDYWPKYPLDQYAGRYTNSTLPMLFLNGDLDGSSPWSNAAFTTFNYSNAMTQRLVRIPTTPHVCFLDSPNPGTPLPCGLNMITKFFLNEYTRPMQNFDTSCTTNIVPLDFECKLKHSKPLCVNNFGTSDIWGYTGPVTFV